MKQYFHVYANGDDSSNFVVSEDDFRFQFNLVAVCTYLSGVTVVSFSIEDSHPHFLLFCDLEACLLFVEMYEKSTLKHIAKTRGSLDGIVFQLEKSPVNDNSYLMNVAAYTIIQPTKDGKRIMYYDYKWGTGSMYFRDKNHVSIWKSISNPTRSFKELSFSEKRKIASNHTISEDWIVCNGLVLPDNYVDVERFESIYRTHNCFRTFAGAGDKHLSEVSVRMAENRGVMMEDLEARKVCSDKAWMMFRTKDIRRLDVNKRLELAVALRHQYRLSLRQLATLTRLPNTEIEKYIR